MQTIIHPTRLGGSSAELFVAFRFLQAGRLPAWPLLSCSYDLLVDGGDRIYKVQVKQAHYAKRNHSLGWTCRFTKRRLNTEVMYLIGEVDYFAIYCDPNQVYVIPSTALASTMNPGYVNKRGWVGGGAQQDGSKWAAYLNTFAIGTGLTDGKQFTHVPKPEVSIQSSWQPHLNAPGHRQSLFAKTPVEGNVDGRRRRVSTDRVLQLQKELGPTPTRAQILAAADALGVTEMTIRNYLGGYRKDLGWMKKLHQEASSS